MSNRDDFLKSSFFLIKIKNLLISKKINRGILSVIVIQHCFVGKMLLNE